MSYGTPLEGPPGGPYLDPVRQDLHIIKCVVVGDSGVGKTRLVCARACNTTYTINQLMQTHCPTVWAIDHYRKDRAVLERSWCVVDGVTVSLRLWDTFGYHDKDRRFAYGRADVILVCFSVVRPRTLRSVINHWMPEVRRFCPGIPVIICGSQADLRYLYLDEVFIKMDKGHFFREINESDIITPDKARLVAEELGAYYYETSVARPYGIDDVFTNVIRAALTYKRDRNFWNILGNLKRIRRPVCQQPMLPPAPAVPVVAVPPPHLTNDLGRLLENQAFCDVIFVAQGVCIPAHRVCLVAGAQVFQDLFCSDVASPTVETAPTTPSPTSTCPNPASTLAKLHRTNSKHSKGSKEKDGAKERSCKAASDTAKLLDNDMTGETSVGNTPTHTASGDLDPNANGGTQTRLLNHTAFRKIHIQQRDDPFHPGNKVIQTVVDLDEQITPTAMLYVLEWLYTGSHPAHTDLAKVRLAANLLGLRDLIFIMTNMINGDEFRNQDVDLLVNNQRIERLRDLCIKHSLLSDVEFQVDDGIVRAHRALLMVRCDVMYGMFSYNFKESSAKVIPFPGVTMSTFRALQEYLYTGQCDVNCIELIELANRMCLPRLLAICEHRLIQELQNAEKEGNDILEDVMLMLEPAQLHNASQLSEWILWYVSCHYRTAYRRFPKLLQQMKPENQIYLSKYRWPPVWYLKELDYYEKCLIELERETKLQPYNRRNSDDCTQSGCLGFCSRNKRRLQAYEPSPTATVVTL